MILDGRKCEGCDEYQAWTRHRLVKQSRSAFAGAASPRPWLPRISLARDASSRDTLLVVFLRGGMDGLTTVVPYGDPNLYSPSLRPLLATPPPGDLNGAVDLDGFFGLSPLMAPLLPAYQSGQLLVVHATGSPDPTRSHFDAFKYMEYGIPLQPLTTFTGWLARHLQVTPPKSNSPLRALSVSNLLPKTLVGGPATLAIPDPSMYEFPGRPETATDRRAVLEAAYASAGEPMAGAAQSTVDTIDLLATINIESYAPSNGAVYPGGAFGEAVRAVAAIVKAEVGLEVAMVELGGWDTHSQQVGSINPLMTNLSGTLAAFHSDMQDYMNGLTVVVKSEFGRRADENGSGGCDHGHGNCMFVMGGNIDGGRVLADWTDGELLHPDHLYEGDSLEVTTDYRDIIAEILVERMENQDLASVFPNYSPTFQGITTQSVSTGTTQPSVVKK